MGFEEREQHTHTCAVKRRLCCILIPKSKKNQLENAKPKNVSQNSEHGLGRPSDRSEEKKCEFAPSLHSVTLVTKQFGHPSSCSSVRLEEYCSNLKSAHSPTHRRDGLFASCCLLHIHITSTHPCACFFWLDFRNLAYSAARQSLACLASSRPQPSSTSSSCPLSMSILSTYIHPSI